MLDSTNVSIITTIMNFISNIVLIISVIFLYIQVKEMRKQIQSQVYQNIVQMFDEFSKIIMQNPRLARVIFNDLKTNDQIQAEWLIFMRFDWFESIVIQKHKYNAIPDDIYNHWMDILRFELNIPLIREIWESSKMFYHPLLQNEVNRILSNNYKSK
jgi:hypothetical protein